MNISAKERGVALMEKGDKFLEIKEKQEVEEIISKIAARIAKNRAVEGVKIEDALGRVSSEDIFSPLDIPPFDRAIMDGYAVIASDTFYSEENNPSLLTIQGYIYAGDFPSGSIESGSCMGISTGAPLPKGANAVVKIEYADEYLDEGEKKRKTKIYKPVAPSENIMEAGADIKQGEKIISKGTLLTQRETGVMAACGLKDILVYKKPVAAIISTGNEITTAGEALTPGKIYDVNSQTIADSVKANGCFSLSLGIAKDDFMNMSAKIKEALKEDVDVIIFSGATSAGAGDVLPEVIEEQEQGSIIVHGVDIKPGKPFIFGIIQKKPIFGLPGNPTSALITFNLFVAPLLRRIAGRNNINEEVREGSGKIKAKVAVRIFSERGRNEYVLLKLEKGGKGDFFAYPILTGSGAITTLSNADGYIFVEKGIEIIEEGEEVEVQLVN